MLPIDLEGEYGRDGGVARTGHYGNEGEGELAHVAWRHAFFVICIGYYLPSDNGLDSANLLEDANRNMCILV